MRVRSSGPSGPGSGDRAAVLADRHVGLGAPPDAVNVLVLSASLGSSVAEVTDGGVGDADGGVDHEVRRRRGRRARAPRSCRAGGRRGRTWTVAVDARRRRAWRRDGLHPPRRRRQSGGQRVGDDDVVATDGPSLTTRMRYVSVVPGVISASGASTGNALMIDTLARASTVTGADGLLVGGGHAPPGSGRADPLVRGKSHVPRDAPNSLRTGLGGLGERQSLEQQDSGRSTGGRRTCRNLWSTSRYSISRSACSGFRTCLIPKWAWPPSSTGRLTVSGGNIVRTICARRRSSQPTS